MGCIYVKDDGEIQLSLELCSDFVVPQNFFGTFASFQYLNVVQRVWRESRQE
jgi:hypothetical protein